MKRKLIFSLVFLLSFLSQSLPSFSKGVEIVDVIDVDRFLLSSGEEVECLGVYIPPLSKRFKEEVLREIKSLVAGKSLRLEFDLNRRGLSGRLQAYIYADGIFVNAELIRTGYALFFSYPGNLKYERDLREFENQAKAEKRGLWNQDSWMTEPCGCY
jgi:micrococcal nuclease